VAVGVEDPVKQARVGEERLWLFREFAWAVVRRGDG
jgi:hypothetical protein